MADETETTDITGLFDDDTRTDEGAEAAESGEVETGETQAEETSEQSEETAEEGSEEQSEPPSDSEEESADNQWAPRAALLDERKKRQQAQEDLERYKREHGISEETDEAPDPRDDPEGYKKHVRQQVERENWEQRVTTSRERMLEKHSDFEEKERHFVAIAQNNPDLVKQMNEHPDPAAFAYEKANESLNEQEKAIENRVVERLRAEGKLKEETGESGESRRSSDSASKVSDLTSAAGAGPNSGEGEAVESTDPADVFDNLSY